MRKLLHSWGRFWFAPEPTSTLALFRIAYGLVILAWGLSLAPDLFSFFSSSGMLAEQPPRDWTPGLLEYFTSDGALVAVYGLLLVGAACLVVGYRTRLAAVVTFVALISLQRRNPFIDNAGDGLLRVLGLYLVLAPAGVSLSLDRWRKARSAFWEFPARAPWALRLVQLQVSVIYLSTVRDKVRGTTWNDGTAVAYALRSGEFDRIGIPDALTDSLFLVNVLTWGTLAIELALAVLIWNRRLRPWVIGLGIALHLSIEITMTLGFFSSAIFVSYVAFVPHERASALLLGLRDRWRARRGEPPEEERPAIPPRRRLKNPVTRPRGEHEKVPTGTAVSSEARWEVG